MARAAAGSTTLGLLAGGESLGRVAGCASAAAVAFLFAGLLVPAACGRGGSASSSSAWLPTDLVSTAFCCWS